MYASKFVRYDNPTVEPAFKKETEEELQREIRSLIHEVQTNNFSIHRRGFRGTHVKSQGVVKGSLTIEPGLPEELAQGICSPANQKANGGKKDVALRFANEPSFLQDDRAPGPRGCALKIFGVTGDFLDRVGEETHTQDLTFNKAPILELRDLPTAVEIFRIRVRNFRTPDKIAEELKKRKDTDLQLAPAQLPNQHFLSYTMYSQSAYRWGNYVAKYALFPTGKLQAEVMQNSKIDNASDPEQHSTWLREYFDLKEATYDLRVQLCEDVEQQSVEDCSMEWDEERFPFRTVAKLTFPAGQDSFDSKRRIFWEDNMKLNVWYGLQDHRPLGSVNRLRKELYQESAKFRGELNASDVVLVDSIDQIP